MGFYRAGEGCRGGLRGAQSMASYAPDDEVTHADVVAQMRARGGATPSPPSGSTVTSRMCANAPDRYAVVYQDFWCIDCSSSPVPAVQAGADGTN
jgi:hypothetical protein